MYADGRLTTLERVAVRSPDPKWSGGNLNRNWKRRAGVVAAIVSLAASGLGCAARSVTPYEQGADRYRFKFSLSRVAGETGTCTAAASVKDRMADRGITITIFTAPWGKKTTAAATDSAYGARLDVAVTVDASGQRGEFVASLHRGDLLIASRTSTLPVAVVTSKMKAVPD